LKSIFQVNIMDRMHQIWYKNLIAGQRNFRAKYYQNGKEN